MAFIWLVMRNSSTRMATHFVICDGLSISINFFLPQQHFKFKSKSSEITLCIVKMTYFTEFFKLIAIILGNVNWRCVEFCLSSVISVLDFWRWEDEGLTRKKYHMRVKPPPLGRLYMLRDKKTKERKISASYLHVGHENTFLGRAASSLVPGAS